MNLVWNVLDLHHVLVVDIQHQNHLLSIYLLLVALVDQLSKNVRLTVDLIVLNVILGLDYLTMNVLIVILLITLVLDVLNVHLINVILVKLLISISCRMRRMVVEENLLIVQLYRMYNIIMILQRKMITNVAVLQDMHGLTMTGNVSNVIDSLETVKHVTIHL